MSPGRQAAVLPGGSGGGRRRCVGECKKVPDFAAHCARLVCRAGRPPAASRPGDPGFGPDHFFAHPPGEARRIMRIHAVAAFMLVSSFLSSASGQEAAPSAAPSAAPPAARDAAGPAKGTAPTSISPASAPESPEGSVVKFKNGSVMPCTIVRESPAGVTVESYGVQFEIAREEIDYYGNASSCPGLGQGEVVGAEEAAGQARPAVTIAPPRPAARPTATREERFRALSRPRPAPGVGAAPMRAATPPQAALPEIEGDPARFQGQRLLFSKVKLGTLQRHEGFFAIELLPPHFQKGGRHRGGSSTALTPQRVTFIITEQQARDLQEHSRQYDLAKVEFGVERKTVGGVGYWVAPISRMDLFRGESDEIAWTIW